MVIINGHNVKFGEMWFCVKQRAVSGCIHNLDGCIPRTFTWMQHMVTITRVHQALEMSGFQDYFRPSQVLRVKDCSLQTDMTGFGEQHLEFFFDRSSSKEIGMDSQLRCLSHSLACVIIVFCSLLNGFNEMLPSNNEKYDTTSVAE